MPCAAIYCQNLELHHKIRNFWFYRRFTAQSTVKENLRDLRRAFLLNGESKRIRPLRPFFLRAGILKSRRLFFFADLAAWAAVIFAWLHLKKGVTRIIFPLFRLVDLIRNNETICEILKSDCSVEQPNFTKLPNQTLKTLLFCKLWTKITFLPFLDLLGLFRAF